MKRILSKFILLLFGVIIGIFIGYKIHTLKNQNLAMQYFVKGNEYYEKGNYLKAAEMTNRSIALDPHWELSFTLLSSSYRKMSNNK